MVRSTPGGSAAHPLTLRTRNWLLIGMIFVVVMLLALITLPPLVSARDDALRAQLDDAQAFADALIVTENDVQQMQSNTRGYLITQAPTFLEQYRATQDKLPTDLERLRELAPRLDSALDAQVAELVEVVERWQRERADRQIALVEQGRVADAAAEVAADDSQALFESFRSRVGDLQQQTQTTQAELREQLNRARALQFSITTGLGVLGLLALGFVIVGFRRMVVLMQTIEVERERTEGLAEQVRAQLQETEQRNQQLTVLNAVALASAQSIQREQRAHNVLATIAHALGLPAGAIWVAHTADRQLELVARHAARNGHLTPAKQPPTTNSAAAQASAQLVDVPGPIIQALRSGNPILVPDGDPAGLPADQIALMSRLGDQIRSGIVLPLRGRGQPIGVLVLASDQPRRFTADELPFFTTLAAEVGVVLENAQLFTEVQTERQRLQTVFDHSPEGIVVVETPDEQIVLANHAAIALLGDLPPRANLRQHPLAGRVYRPGGEPCPLDELPLVRTLREGVERRGVELIIEQPDGQRVPVLVTSVPLRDEDGALRGAVAVFQDLRQLREVERLKSDFVALVSHELRTPLTTIKGCTETLLRGYGDSDPARTREFLEIIDVQAERLQELIDNLLNLSQLEAGALRLRRDLLAPQTIIQGVIRQVRERLGDVRLQADLPPTLPLISADGRRIEQVLLNLIENARKFSPPGGVITIGARHAAKEVVIGVRDQGPGIPEAERERVFERFYQVEQSTTRNVGGTGLGLAICKALIEAHGGRIWIDEAPGGGALVQFSLPALPLEESASAAGGTNVMARQHAGATRVLVVDDDPALRRLLEGGLSEAGYSVQAVVEAQAALEAVAQQPPDIILLDLMLPGVDGFAVCKQLREWTSVPIIMLTARAAEKDIVLGLQLGADDYVTKPFRMNELLARMEAVLRRAQPDVAPGEVSLIQVGELAIDLAARRVMVEGAEVNLTPTEYRILTYLARHAGQVLTHEQILAEVWGPEYGGENHYLWVHIAHLRQKIEPDSKNPRYLLTERGVGYRLVKE